MCAYSTCSGTKNPKYLEENVGAFDVQLTPEEVQQVRAEIEQVEIVGDRYPPVFQQVSFADTASLEP